ncbi:MAG: iron export ABC transporter permease subunit FetB [Oxalobacteraceae bacterium]|jgi:putative ABC transport system permease protein|nr:MAG: iron export ABC transporter permease subunit FetB [Oxalobacteraceae bacterium]
MNAIQLGFEDVALAGSLIIVSAVLSIVCSLGVHRQIVWAAARMVVQLLLVGVALRWVFRSGSPALTLGVAFVMFAAAAREVAARPEQRLVAFGNYRIAAATVGMSSIVTVVLALLTVIRPQPWYDPRYAIPLMGIVLGSVLNSASLGLDTFFASVSSSKPSIEARLALGATAWQATDLHVRAAIRKGLIPIINQMSAAGIITLPGIMTGQILAGMDPLEAVKYQILLLFLLTGASALATVCSVVLAARSVTDERHRLRLDHLTDRR